MRLRTSRTLSGFRTFSSVTGQIPPFAKVAAITAIVSQFASMAQHLPIKIKIHCQSIAYAG